MNQIRAIIPAAGKGKRLQTINGDLAKAMFPVEGRPMLDIVLENIGFIDRENVYIVVGYKKESIMEHLGNNFHYTEQTEQLGTGHAVMTCADAFRDFEGSVLVTFGDMPLFRREEMEKMCSQHQENGADCTLMTAENPDLTMWAKVARDANGNFAAIVEGKDCNEEQKKIKELFSGVMVFNSKSLFEILPQVGCANAQKEYYLTEVPELMVKQGMKVETYFIPDGDDLRGVNTPEELEVCERILRQRYALV